MKEINSPIIYSFILFITADGHWFSSNSPIIDTV